MLGVCLGGFKTGGVVYVPGQTLQNHEVDRKIVVVLFLRHGDLNMGEKSGSVTFARDERGGFFVN